MARAQRGCPGAAHGHYVAEGRVDIDGTVLHIDPGEIISGIAYELADSRIGKANGRADAELSPRNFFLETVHVIYRHGSTSCGLIMVILRSVVSIIHQ